MMPLMPKSTAVWLIDNTTLTFKQIADFCDLHLLEIQAIADDSIGRVAPFDPTIHGQLTREEIARCEQNPSASLERIAGVVEHFRHKVAKYMPKAKRQIRPNGILWLLKEYPIIADAKICNLLGTTKSTVTAIRNKSYKNYGELKAQHPVKLGLCSQIEFDAVVASTQLLEERG
jgi:uncharacterized protein